MDMAVRSSRTGSPSISGVRDPLHWVTLGMTGTAAAIALAMTVMMSAGPARAADDGTDQENMSFEERMIDKLMAGLGAKGSLSKDGIDYRERSPLVVPPNLDLPPPSSAESRSVPNWPKDPDERRRKAAIAARKKEGNKPTPWEAARPLTPSELNAGRTAAPARENNDPVKPGEASNPSLSPAQLGYTGGLFGIFKGNKAESKQFKEEPPRTSLVDPPPGYQTPSSDQPYGTGPAGSQRTYFDIMSGKDKPE